MVFYHNNYVDIRIREFLLYKYLLIHILFQSYPQRFPLFHKK
jgi:hypothetical protein